MKESFYKELDRNSKKRGWKMKRFMMTSSLTEAGEVMQQLVGALIDSSKPHTDAKWKPWMSYN